MQNKRYLSRSFIALALILGLLAGCGRKPKVTTEATPPTPVQTQVAPEPAPVPPPPPPAPAPVDYAALEPNSYGIGDVFFPYDAFAITEVAMATLEKNAAVMKSHAAVTYLVEGHCDERGTVEYNLALGEKRAKAVRDYLVTLGVPAAQMKVVSYGKERPFVTGKDEASWSQNRRAHFARP